MITTSNLGALMGAPVIGSDGDKIGTVAQLFVDPESGQPNWITVNTGWFGTKETFVPLDRATWDNERVHVDLDRDLIKGAPHVDSGGALSEAEQAQLYHYYNTEQRDDERDRDRHHDRDDRHHDRDDRHHDRDDRAHDWDDRPRDHDDRDRAAADRDRAAADRDRADADAQRSQSGEPPVPTGRTGATATTTDASAAAPASGDSGAATPDTVPQPGKVPAAGGRMRKYVVTEVYLDDDGTTAGNEGTP